MLFNLTQSQLLIWTGQQINPDSPLYNMVLVFDLAGSVEEDHFQMAFQKLVNRSEALRTVFLEEDGVPKQKILDQLPYKIETVEVSGGDDELRKWEKARSRAMLDLSTRAFDSVLIRTGSGRYHWFLNQHHLITDAWGVSVLYNDMARLYALAIKGSLDNAPAVPLFRDYLAYEQEIRQDPAREAVNGYWQNKLAGIPVAPRLYGYTDNASTTRSNRVSVDLGPERSVRIRKIVKEKELRSWTSHLSIYNLFATILFAFLNRVSGQRKIAIGTPAHNRATPAFKETPGVFIEIFPILAEVDENESFVDLFQKVRTEVHEFLRYAQPGAGSPGLSRSFNVVLNYIHATFPDFNGIPASSEWVHHGHCDPRHHLRLHVHDFDTSGSIQLHFDLNCLVFDDEQRQNVSRHFLNLMDAFLVDRNQPVGQPSMATREEIDQLTFRFNATVNPAPGVSSIPALFKEQVRKTPDAPALLYEDRSYSYQEIDEKSARLAHYLQQKGISPGSRVALYLPRTPDLLISILAVWKAGGCYIPIATDYPAGRLSYMISDGEVAMLISCKKFSHRLPRSGTSVCYLDEEWANIEKWSASIPQTVPAPGSTAYIMYTSGSTGQPKGVMISHLALANYIGWASEAYRMEQGVAMPLFTSTGFDLTVTSIFLPLVNGGRVVIYEETGSGPDLSLLKVLSDNAVDLIKLTPSHLALLKGRELQNSNITTMIVGGEDFKSDLAKSIYKAFGGNIRIYNEYGPTEATVGCIVHRYNNADAMAASVPIGKPVANMKAYVLDSRCHPVPRGVPGELYIAGKGLSDGYWNKPELTKARFLPDPFRKGEVMYRTGDHVRMNPAGELEYLGRIDQQLKIGGIRVEPGEIEAALVNYPGVQQCVVDVQERQKGDTEREVHYCTKCGLPSNYPTAEFDEAGVCNLCRSFESYRQKAVRYFKGMEELKGLFRQSRQHNPSAYDCMMLLSGGKDSTFALGQLIEMGLKVLAFTLDNGYISEQAKANIKRVVDELGVDHVFGQTPAMNAIFVDSLNRHSNVCNGCFKTIYTLSFQIALEKGIPYIVTGLSRGQFFETRLTEELFWNEEVDVDAIDHLILEARKAYHRVDDAVCRLMDVSMFEDEEVFNKVQFVDFYRYCDVSLEEMLTYLDNRLPWIRPTDTGRSTNCLINQVGIFVHKKEQGYNNYAFPYSWDVRIGHKTRDAALEEINEDVDETEVRRIMNEIGYPETPDKSREQQHLVAWFTADAEVSSLELKKYLENKLPEYMVPTHFLQVGKFPLTANGKINRQALPAPDGYQHVSGATYQAPETEIEIMLESLWSDILQVNQIGKHDNFIELGGHSLAAIRLMARINEAFHLELPLNIIFEKPTIGALGSYIEETILLLMNDKN